MSPLLTFLQAACLAAFAGLLVVAAWQDLRTMRIANTVSIAIVAVFAIWALAGLASGRMTVGGLGWALACGLGVFGAGALLFVVGALGGGDVKLLAAASLFAGPAWLTDLLLVMAFGGGAMGFAVLCGLPIGPSAPGNGSTVAARLRGGLPYGPAIAAGGLWTAFNLIQAT